MPYNVAIGIMQATAIVPILFNIKTIMPLVIGRFTSFKKPDIYRVSQKKVPSIETILLLLSTGFHAPGN